MQIPVSEMEHEQGRRPTFVVVPANAGTGHDATVSIALPSSILSNAQSPELRMYLAGQIARAAAIYCIDEVVVFREHGETTEDHRDSRSRHWDKNESDPTMFFKLILEYLETPQYLRKHMFPVSRDLRLVGVLNPLALPSHVSKNEFCRWREGIAVGRLNYSRNQGRRSNHHGDASGAAPTGPPTKYIDVGQERLAEIDSSVSVGERVTVDMEPSGPEYASCPGKYLFGRLADRDSVKRDGGYWGYKVRIADSLSAVFRDSEVVPEGYDLTVGTSERGTPIGSSGDGSRNFELPEYSHLLIVFGGVQGLERSVQGDKELEELGVFSSPTDERSIYEVGELFDFYVNTCPAQGSRTIRTEEAILVSLAALQPYLKPRNR